MFSSLNLPVSTTTANNVKLNNLPLSCFYVLIDMFGPETTVCCCFGAVGGKVVVQAVGFTPQRRNKG